MFSPPPERHKKGSLVKGRCAAAVNAYTVPMFSLPILLGNDTGRVREVTNRRKPPCEIVSGHCPQGSLAKGSWHAGGVTEGFTAGTFFFQKPNVKSYAPHSSLREGAGTPEA